MLLVVKKMKSLTLILLVTFTSLSLKIDLWAEVIQDSGQQLTSSSETQANTQHDEFVQKFEEKLATLLTNLKATEKYKGVEVKDKVKSAKDHLSDNLPTESKHISTPTPTHRIKPLKQAPRQDARKFSQEFFAKISDFFRSEVQAAEDYLGETVEVQFV